MQVDPLAFAAIGGGANKLATEVTYGQAWGMEAILTFSLVMMVFAATDNFHAAKVSHLPVSSPLLENCHASCLSREQRTRRDFMHGFEELADPTSSVKCLTRYEGT